MKALGLVSGPSCSTFSMELSRYVRIFAPLCCCLTSHPKSAVIYFLIQYTYFSSSSRTDGWDIGQFEFSTVRSLIVIRMKAPLLISFDRLWLSLVSLWSTCIPDLLLLYGPGGLHLLSLLGWLCNGHSLYVQTPWHLTASHK